MASLQHQQITTPLGFGIIALPQSIDERGILCVIDSKKSGFPFEVKRVFWIYNVPTGQMRGQHAHHTCAEVLVPICGSFTAHVTNGQRSEDFVMNDRSVGLYVPAMTWCSFTDFSADCVCLCLTSQAYDPDGYINDLQDFFKEKGIER